MGVKAAKAYLESTGHAKDKVLVVYLPDCHESVAGISCWQNEGILSQTGFCYYKNKRGV